MIRLPRLSELPRTSLLAPNLNQGFQIVGVVADVRNDGLHRPIVPEIYLPSTLFPAPWTTMRGSHFRRNRRH